MKWGMVIDLTKCMRCHGCVAACRVEHFLPFSIAWVKLIAYEVEDKSVVDVTTYAVRCNQCKDAPCIDVCPTEATHRRDDGIVDINSDLCIGCRYCVIACPYQNRTFLSKDKMVNYFPNHAKTRFELMREKKYPHQVGTTQKCNFCAERIDDGMSKGLTPGADRGATPACVNTCQARALTFGDLDDPNSKVSKLIVDRKGTQLHSEYGTDPSVYYVDGKIGGKSNIAPDHAQTGCHIKEFSSVEKRAKEIFSQSK
jgi:phenylacetyl-CoA:acceptor oxidoreductase 27-kDa subunit